MDHMLKQDEHYVMFGISGPCLNDSVLPEIKFELHSLENPSEPIFLGEAKSGTNTKGLLQYLKLLKMEINLTNYAKVIEAFDFMHPWERIIQNTNDFNELGLLVSKEDKPKIKIYDSIIHPAEFQTLGEEGGKIIFWTRNIIFGHLKRWIILVDSKDKIQIEEEIIENRLFAVLR